MAEKAKEKEEIEEKLKYGATEAEVVAEGQAWSLAAGTSGRYLDIVTMHHADVPHDATEPAIKSKIAQIHDCLKKLTTGSNLGNPPWKVLKAEPIPHISKREMRWRIGPVHHSIYSKEVARLFHEGVTPTCFGDTIHYTGVDLGLSAGVVKVIGVTIGAGVRKELTDNMILESQNRLPNRWLGERPPTRISQNTKEGTDNIKLEVESWEIAKMLVSSGIVIKGKKCQVELWGQPSKPQTKATGSFHTPTNTPAKRQNATRNAPQTPSGRDIRCFKCGKVGHMQYQCPDLGMEHCDRCGARGHLEKECNTTQRRLALGMRGGAAKKHQNPPPGRPHGAKNPSNAPNAPKDAPTAP